MKSLVPMLAAWWMAILGFWRSDGNIPVVTWCPIHLSDKKFFIDLEQALRSSMGRGMGGNNKNYIFGQILDMVANSLDDEPRQCQLAKT